MTKMGLMTNQAEQRNTIAVNLFFLKFHKSEPKGSVESLPASCFNMRS